MSIDTSKFRVVVVGGGLGLAAMVALAGLANVTTVTEQEAKILTVDDSTPQISDFFRGQPRQNTRGRSDWTLPYDVWGITIFSPEQLPNTDQIDPFGLARISRVANAASDVSERGRRLTSLKAFKSDRQTRG